MDQLTLARWQFGITTVYHFFFVPLTLGLVWVVAIFQSLWVAKGDEVYKRMTKFWGKLFLINFAMGVATGIGCPRRKFSHQSVALVVEQGGASISRASGDAPGRPSEGRSEAV